MIAPKKTNMFSLQCYTSLSLSLVLRINEKPRVSAEQSTDAVYWCIANFPICYSLNIRYTYTHNEYRAAKHKQNNPLYLIPSYVHSPRHTCRFSPVLFRYKFCLEDGKTSSWKYQLLGGSLGLIWDSGTISLMLSTKTVEKKVSNPTKVCLITNYWAVLKTNISSRLYSHLYSSRNVFPGKVSREEHERTRRKKLTQPTLKKIVTRKLSNKVPQLLTDFLCTDKLIYWRFEVVISNKLRLQYFNFDVMWYHVRSTWVIYRTKDVIDMSYV